MLTEEVYALSPPSERGRYALVLALFLLGCGMLIAALSGMLGETYSSIPASAPSPALVAGATQVPRTPVVATARATTVPRVGLRRRRSSHHTRRAPAVALRPLATIASTEESEMLGWTDIPTRWIEAFYPIYAEAQRTFKVNWLLIASIHKQESAFSTDPTTYHGLNFAGCCGGPMQFNVTNGPATTWDIARDAFRLGKRPAVYGHRTTHHPSIYDDYDSIMAAAWLLSSDGAGLALNASAWSAAYDYYGHDATGVSYADEVLGRAISWSQHGFCVNCSLQAGMVKAVHATYGIKQCTPRPRPRLPQDTRRARHSQVGRTAGPVRAPGTRWLRHATRRSRRAAFASRHRECTARGATVGL